jgi:hypothetical protein
MPFYLEQIDMNAPLGKSSHSWEYNIKIHTKEVGYYSVNMIFLKTNMFVVNKTVIVFE